MSAPEQPSRDAISRAVYDVTNEMDRQQDAPPAQTPREECIRTAASLLRLAATLDTTGEPQ